MKKLSLILLLLGPCLIVGGCTYDVMYAGIPYQDPTPELRARYVHHAGVAKEIMLTGIVSLMAGGTIAFFSRKKRTSVRADGMSAYPNQTFRVGK